jgi:hypothetical protein
MEIQDFSEKKVFRWEGYSHFENTAKKYIKQSIGPEFLVPELIDLCERIYSFEARIMDDVDNGHYLLPSGVFISELKRVKTPQKFFLFYNHWKNVVQSAHYEGFKVNPSINSGTYINPKKHLSDLVEKYNTENTYPFLRSDEIPFLPGVYFLYGKDKELLYIGKSYCLAQRVYSSAAERRGVYYARIMICAERADADIIEPYCIAMHTPPLNTAYSGVGKPSFRIETPELSDFINLINI